MKTLLFLSFFFFLFYSALPQGCPQNYNFEDSSTVGWICKSGYYGGGPCPGPIQIADSCPSFQTIFPVANNGICINAHGRNASLNSGVDRHVIVDNNYVDSNSIPPLQAVDLLGGNFSFRLGDAVAGGVIVNGKNYARAEAIRLAFRVDSTNARMLLRYAAFLQDAGHLPEEQPRFEILLTDSLDSILPCGYYKIVAGISNPHCNGTGNFHQGVGQWKYTDWTSIALDLSNYITKRVNIEFRTTDCFACSGTNCTGCTVVVNGGCATTTCNGVSCTSSNCGGGCTGIPTCSNIPGSHNAYAYIDAACYPISIPSVITTSFVCGAASLTLCAPVGYFSYQWDSLAGGATTDCVTINNPVAGSVYHVTYQTNSLLSCTSHTTAFTLSCTVGINDLYTSNTSIIISPNPLSSSFKIQFNTPIKNAEMVICDLLGNEVLRKHLEGSTTEIERGSLRSGVYFVRVDDADRKFIQKLIIE